ncbi:MAG: alanine racemase [bacterium]
MQPVSWIEISRDNLIHNINKIKNVLGNHQLGVVVKANAYGHGLGEVVTAVENEVDYFQVDDFQELVGIRNYTQKPILVLGYMNLEESLIATSQHDAILGVFESNHTKFSKLNTLGKELQKKIKVHVEVDALLGRLGSTPEHAQQLISDLKQYEHIEVLALYAHFSDIEDAGNLDHAHVQHHQLKNLAEHLGIPYHISATSGILSDQGNNWGGFMARLGIGLYGIWPSESLFVRWHKSIDFKPVLSWKTTVAQVKTLPKGYPIGYGRSYITSEETTIAVIPQGYSDGYDRRFSNKGIVLIKGTGCPILGRIAMNMFVVDVSHLESVAEGDEVVLIGGQGNETISAELLARISGSINYEILARISPLLNRKVV